MTTQFQEQQAAYAELIIRLGVNLQPAQSLRIGAELEHAPFVRLLVTSAYKAGARYVHVDWDDSPTSRARLLHSNPDNLDFMPDYEVTRHREMVDDTWARLSLDGSAFPDIFDDIDPALMRRMGQTRRKRLKFYGQAQMANELQWCVAAVPTRAWAQKIYPTLSEEAAISQLWSTLLHVCRVDETDVLTAWQLHDQRLKRVVNFMAQQQIRTIHYFDPALGPDGKPSTDLTVGLTDFPRWIAASSQTPAGVEFFANLPTEEVFSTPHNARTEGWARTSKPTFPFEREVNYAYFRFEQGKVVEFHAQQGQEVLEQFFEIRGTRQLGECSLVDVCSPINQAGVTFYSILFDENAVSHIAFGEAYPEGVEGSEAMAEEQLRDLGVNDADSHLDFMIGTPTMHVYGQCADGQEVTVMHNGQFTAEVLGEAGEG